MTTDIEDSRDAFARDPSTDGNCDSTGNDAEKQLDGDDNDHGDIFGDGADTDIKYRTLTWWQAGVIMVAETISLGILSLPSAFAAVGMVPGLILVVGLGLIATYTGYVIGQFKARYPHVHNMADVGEILLGPIGREVFGATQTIFLIFAMGSHILSFTLAFDTITGHATCTIVWGIVGMVLLLVLSLPRTLKNVSYLAIASFLSIFIAVMVTMIAIGIEEPDPGIQATANISFARGFQSVSNIILAYGGHVTFFSFISEMKEPKDFPKALYFLQSCDITLYTIVSVVVYYYGGRMVASPALESTGLVVRKIAFGIALPTILIAGVIYANVAVKYVYVRLYRGTRHMSQRTLKSMGTWVGLMATAWIIAWIISESIPVFNNLLGLISALFVSWFAYGLSGFLWMFMNYGQWFTGWKNTCLTACNLGIIGIGFAACGLGLYTNGKAIHDDSGSGHSWSCSGS